MSCPFNNNSLNLSKDSLCGSIYFRVKLQQGLFCVILQGVPDHANKQQIKEFHTELLSALMEHLTAADAFLDESSVAPPLPFANLPFGGAGSLQAIGSNTIYVADRIVDQLWSGTYTRDPREVLQFVWRLVVQMRKRRSTTLQQLELVYRCLNRTSLFLLSRPVQHQKMNVALDVLHWLVTQRNVMFASANADKVFFGCLCYLLIQVCHFVIFCQTMFASCRVAI